MYLSSQVYPVDAMPLNARRSDAGELRAAALAVPLGRSVERPALAALERLGRPGAGLAGSRCLASRRGRLRAAPAGRARRPGVARAPRRRSRGRRGGCRLPLILGNRLEERELVHLGRTVSDLRLS